MGSGGGGKAGDGGRGGGGGGGGGANITWTGQHGGQGSDGGNATAGSDGGNGGTGGGLFVVFANSISGAGSISANGSIGSNGGGTGGSGGNGGYGGDGGDSDCSGSNDQSAGGGGGGGDGGDGGNGSGGGGGGAGGTVRLGGVSNTFSGTITLTAGSGGTGGAGGAAGSGGSGGAKGSNGACCSNASNGSNGSNGTAGSTGATGSTGSAGVSLSNTTVPNFTLTGCAQILPVELIYFYATAEDHHVRLNWATGSETNNDFFTVERSADGKSFEKAIQVTGAGSSSGINNYSAFDESPLKGISYYRLRQTDYNGKYSLSPSTAVLFDTPYRASVFPTVVENNTFFLSTEGAEGEEVLVILYNEMGETVFSKVLMQQSGRMLTAIDIGSRLPAGIYFITGTSRNEFFREKLLIK